MSVGDNVDIFFLFCHHTFINVEYDIAFWSVLGDAGPKIKADLTIIMSSLNPEAREQLS